MPVARAGGGGQETVLNFAHFANGLGTTSDLVFVNVSPRPSGPGLTPYHAVILPSRPTLYFYDQEGNLLDPASVVDLTGDLMVTEDGALSIQTEMEPLGEITVSTHGRGELVSGSVKVVSEGPLGGVLRYALPGIGVTGVGASQAVRDALFPVRQEGNLETAAAIRNVAGSDLVATCRLMKDGAVLEETEVPLAANGEVAAIYKARWQIELFFKWVKQHLKLKSFLGTTANAVMTQVWVALCVYLLVAYVKFLLRPPGRLYEIFKRLQVTALEYRALGQVLAWEAKKGPKRAPKWRQRNLFARRLKPLFVGG